MIADNSRLSDLFIRAQAARLHAHCPYSQYAVGTAVRTIGGQVYAGCNVENASYGLTICAERNAIATAVAAGMRAGELAALALVAASLEDALTADESSPRPCGACLQVIAEFAASDMQITCATPGQSLDSARVYTLQELLPLPFEAARLRPC